VGLRVSGREIWPLGEAAGETAQLLLQRVTVACKRAEAPDPMRPSHDVWIARRCLTVDEWHVPSRHRIRIRKSGRHALHPKLHLSCIARLLDLPVPLPRLRSPASSRVGSLSAKDRAISAKRVIRNSHEPLGLTPHHITLNGPGAPCAVAVAIAIATALSLLPLSVLPRPGAFVCRVLCLKPHTLVPVGCSPASYLRARHRSLESTHHPVNPMSHTMAA
jgi:hypothetical protein